MPLDSLRELKEWFATTLELAPPWMLALAALALAVGIALFAHYIVLRILERLIGARRVFLSLLLTRTAGPTRLAVVIFAVSIVTQLAPVDPAVTQAITHALLIAFIILVGWMAMIAVGIAAIPDYVRITRGTVLSLMEQEFVLAARVVGCRDHAIIFRHILPNVTAPLTVLATLGIAGAIITGSALSFLGLGVRPPAPEWGNMLAEGREFLEHAWWVAFFPGLAIMLAVFSINLLGDGLRDALDPRLRA